MCKPTAGALWDNVCEATDRETLAVTCANPRLEKSGPTCMNNTAWETLGVTCANPPLEKPGSSICNPTAHKTLGAT
jgi:hypothetical protein